MKITEKHFLELTRELRTVQDALTKSLEEQSKAASFGDLSENEEYASARANSERLLKRKRDIEYELSDVEIVPMDQSPKISLGSTVKVTKVTKDGTPLAEARQFILESAGDTVLKGILGVNSPLGKEILNGSDGIYFVHTNGGIYYKVEKVLSV